MTRAIRAVIVGCLVVGCVAFAGTHVRAQDVLGRTPSGLSKLNGRYSFRLTGNGPGYNAGSPQPPDPYSEVGVLTFDGNGHVTDARGWQTHGGDTRAYPGGYLVVENMTFVSGTYSVTSMDTGHITLTFQGNFESDFFTKVLDYDIALFEGGHGFDMNLDEVSVNGQDFGSGLNLRLTLNGVARKQ